MDHAVTLVRAYLNVNGYFTITEYPIIEATPGGSYRTVTDLDLLAFRFPGAGRLLTGDGEGSGRLEGFEPDPELGASPDVADMIVGEVKEGRAELNRGATHNAVLRSALTRFGCCEADHIESALGELRERGRVSMPDGHEVRLLAFGSAPPEEGPRNFQVVTLGHVLDFLRSYIDEYWEVLRHSHFKDPGFGHLLTLEKARRG